MGKAFSKTRFVTVNFISDWLNWLRDFFGYEQKTYNDVVNNTSDEMLAELEAVGEFAWFRMEVDRTFDTTLQVTIYGQYK